MINRQELLDRVDNDVELLSEIMAIFHEDYPRLAQEIRIAIDANNADALVKPAHTLKGSVANFACPEAFEKAYALEKQGRENQMDLAGQTFRELESAILEMETDLGVLAKELRT